MALPDSSQATIIVTPGRFSSRARSASPARPAAFGLPRHPERGEQPLFQNFIGDIVRQWPLQPRRRRPFQIVLDRVVLHAKKSPDLARGLDEPIVVKPQSGSESPASLSVPVRRHPVLTIEHPPAAESAQVLTCGEQSERTKKSAQVACFTSGIAAGFNSDRWPASNRNTRPDRIGIRILS